MCGDGKSFEGDVMFMESPPSKVMICASQFYKVTYMDGEPIYVTAISFHDAFEYGNEFGFIKAVEIVYEEAHVTPMAAKL
jgi:hypothetical protein